MRIQIESTSAQIVAKLQAAAIMGNVLAMYLSETPRTNSPMKGALVQAMSKFQLDFDAWVNLLFFYFPQFKDLASLKEYWSQESYTYTNNRQGERQMAEFGNELYLRVVASEQKLNEVAI